VGKKKKINREDRLDILAQKHMELTIEIASISRSLIGLQKNMKKKCKQIEVIEAQLEQEESGQTSENGKLN
jgi:septal ring factor EnvC (AmiA/AmiB activator)